MSFLRTNSNTSQIPLYTGLQVQTASAAVPVQIVYGANKVAPNCFWTGRFLYKAQKSGGKGGGTLQGYTYTDDIMLGLCEGPIKAVGGVFNGQSITFMWNLGLSLYYGSQNQTPWPYLYSQFPGQALSYHGLAFVCAANFYLGSSPNLPSLAFDVHGILVDSGGLAGNEWDASPALVIQDFLTNPQYGVGFPAASINAASLLTSAGGASSYQNYCQAYYLAISPALANQETASSILTRWLMLTNSAAVWSGGQLKFIPYGDSTVSGSGATFTPNLTPVYSLSDDDFVHEDGKDPVEVVRSDPFTAKNWISLEILDRNNYYDATPVQAWDQNAIQLYGLNVDSTITAHEICNQSIASNAAQLILQRRVYIRNTYIFKLSFEYCLLEPMDLVAITDAGLGMTNVAVRIISIEEDDAGILTVTAEEFPPGIATPPTYNVQLPTATVLDHGVVPSPVNPPIIFEPPAALTGGDAEVWIAVSGGLQPVYFLAEDASTGAHSASATMPASQPSGTLVSFQLAVQPPQLTSGVLEANARTSVRLNGYNGSGMTGVDFNLVTGAAGIADPGISTATISPLAGGWFTITIGYAMMASAAPSVTLELENPFLMTSYAGTVGCGVNIWQLSYAVGDESASIIAPLSSVSGATIAAASGVASPEGAVGGADPYWGGAFVYLSTDGSTYAQVGQVSGPARQGLLNASVAAPSAQPDVANTISVNLAESGGALASGTQADAQNAVTLCIVDQELFAYETATLAPGNTYDLTYLYRGLYGSAAAAHEANAPFARLDDLIFEYALPPQFVGVTIYLKFQSFNIFGQGVQDLSTCAVYSYTPTSAGVIGPVTRALLAGSSVDYGLASAGANESDDWGLASDAYVTVIDLGMASS